MTKQNKLIVGAVVVLGAYYLYHNYKVKNEVTDLKAGADVTSSPAVDNTVGGTPLTSENGEIKLLQNDLKKGQAQVTEMSFDGKKSKSMFSTTF